MSHIVKILNDCNYAMNTCIFYRYRKKNLFLEPQFSPGNEDDSTAIFYTDFGVKFTLQVIPKLTNQIKYKNQNSKFISL